MHRQKPIHTLIAIVATCGLIALCAATGRTAPNTILTFDGLAPVRIGMSLTQAEAALGTKLKSVYPDMPASCWFGNRADGVDGPVSYMIENGKVARIDIDDHTWPSSERTVPSVTTGQGIRIDSPADSVRKAYGSRLASDFHPQGNVGDENYLYMQVLSDDKRYGLLFDIRDGKVKNFRTGTAGTFRTDEPCN